MVDGENLVGQIEHQVPHGRVACQTLSHRFELKAQLITEGAIEPQVFIGGAREVGAERPQHREDAGLATAGFLWTMPGRRQHLYVQRVAAPSQAGEIGMPAQRALQFWQQHFPAGIERLDAHGTPPGGEHHGRIHKADVPAGIAPRVFESGREQHSTLGVQALTQPGNGIGLGNGKYRALHAHAAGAGVMAVLHGVQMFAVNAAVHRSSLVLVIRGVARDREDSCERPMRFA